MTLPVITFSTHTEKVVFKGIHDCPLDHKLLSYKIWRKFIHLLGSNVNLYQFKIKKNWEENDYKLKSLSNVLAVTYLRDWHYAKQGQNSEMMYFPNNNLHSRGIMETKLSQGISTVEGIVSLGVGMFSKTYFVTQIK